MQNAETMNGLVIGDGHVHIHDLFDMDRLLTAAAKNFSHQAERTAHQGEPVCYLLLTESFGCDFFARLRDKDLIPKVWTVKATGEENCLHASCPGRVDIFLVAGRQIVTRERLEILALGLSSSWPDGRNLDDVLDQLSPLELPLVLPWGAGKWLGKRGRLVRKIIQSQRWPMLFVGDNANRPFFWSRSQLIREAEKMGIRNLQGSDPLPFRNQETRAGSFGFCFSANINATLPFRSLVNHIINPQTRLFTYGTPESMLSFFYHQISLQLAKLRG